MKLLKDTHVITAICYIALGAVLFLYPALALNLVCSGIGIVVLVFGLMKLLSYFKTKTDGLAKQLDLVIGIILSVLGIFILVKPGLIAAMLPFAVGVYIFFDSVLNIRQALELKNVGFERWWSMLVIAVIMVVLGIIMICNPFKTAALTVRVIGAIFFCRGISNIITVWFTEKQVSNYNMNFQSSSQTVIDVEGKIIDDDEM